MIETDFYSRILSSAQRLPIVNTLICNSDYGYFFEITPTEEIVWEYINPVTPTGILSQGDDSTSFTNLSFRVLRYAADYPAFAGRTLTTGAPVEQNPDLMGCTILSVSELKNESITLSPKPIKKILSISVDIKIDKVEIYSILDELIKTTQNKTIDFSNQRSGLYIVKIYSDTKISTTKVIKE